MTIQFQLRRASNIATRQICMRYGHTLGMQPVLEYPKCGGTWLCRMLADALSLPFAQYSCAPVAMPCVLPGHWKYSPRLHKPVFLQRDGRDVIVSFYFHCTRRYTQGVASPKIRSMIQKLYGPDTDLNDDRENLPRFITEMFANPVGARANWSDYSRSWAGKSGVVYAKYEALRQDCTAELSRIIVALGRESPEWRIERAVDTHSMQRVTGRAPGQEDRTSFIRKGVVGDWVNSFNEESMEIFSDLAGQTLVEIGYENSSDWKSWAVQA